MVAVVDPKGLSADVEPTTLNEIWIEAKNNPFTVVVCLFLALGGFAHGYDNGVIGGATVMQHFRTTMGWPQDAAQATPESTNQLMWIVTSFAIGATVSAFFGGQYADKYGRRIGFGTGALLFTIGGAVQCFGSSYIEMVIGRVIAGVAVGFLSCISPMYSSEVSTPMMRGVLTSFYQIYICVAIVIASLLNIALNNIAIGWRISLGVQVILGGIMTIGVLFMPESPKWLLRKNRKSDCIHALFRLRGCPNKVNDELLLLESEIEKEVEETGGGAQLSWAQMFSISRVRNTVIIGVLIQFFQIMTGVNAIMFYVPDMLAVIGIDALSSALAANCIFLLGVVVELFIVDLVGRRKLLLWGMNMQVVTLVTGGVIALGFHNDLAHQPVAEGLVVVCICLFLGAFGVGYGPGAWCYCSEMFSPMARGKGIGITTSANWGTSIITSVVTPHMYTSSWGTGGTLVFFGIISAVAVPFTYFMIPETKGVHLEGMTVLFNIKEYGGWAKFMRANASGKQPASAKLVKTVVCERPTEL
uniref:Hexose transporter 1 n=1 Tax=Mucochytrium quahogii TaxID=96639 RepID=A0A7S2WRU3_9STRA|mmetsp:Transcript_20736/g.34236  ORF Transcript_20736/g.34236 Transcript_20736/m.34236 type:complete len:529 (+) Transcript_20736:1008-2594(+)|eukprot:CAMPEP_0203762936 /NCGR_PEP_ID=MMETSP0098-20131031/15703_1 /ASSEMBLY_ACC=CAM_ASM_000208 /TAXON_ID=96639 /ORGANISM=" , Strain NY0313808BC1" /LENGTH=528 /DNA_ID=CAMNT_0050657533 /DNA_START=969 /DNA_END=2555 /DNA_ORIENTATION=-